MDIRDLHELGVHPEKQVLWETPITKLRSTANKTRAWLNGANYPSFDAYEAKHPNRAQDMLAIAEDILTRYN